MPARFFVNLMAIVMLGGALVLSGCASDNMNMMHDSMDDKKMMKESMGDSMDDSMMKESMGAEKQMKDTM